MSDLTLAGARIVDVHAGRVQPPHDIEITADRITRLLPARTRPLDRDGVVVDCSGGFVLPGLVDSHIHIVETGESLLCVANGVTTVRHMDGSPLQLAMESRFMAGDDLAPTVFSVSPIVDGTGADGYPTVAHAAVCPPVTALPAFVASLAARGYRQLKVYDRLTAEQHRALCAAAAEVSMSVTGHCPRSLTMEQAMAHGQVCFEHLSGVTQHRLSARPGGAHPQGAGRITDAAARVDFDSVAKLGRLMADRGVWLCPTTQVMRGSSVRDGDEATPATYLNRAFRVRWRPPESVSVGGAPVPWDEYAEALQAWHDAQIRCLDILRGEGVPILAGTDFPTPGVVPGFSLHDELDSLVRAGCTRWQALRAVTADAARFMAVHLGVTDRFGAVEVGCRADLLVVAGDPTSDLATMRDPLGVVLRGNYHSRQSLSERLAIRRQAVTVEPAVPAEARERCLDASRSASAQPVGQVPAGSVEVATGEIIDQCGEHTLHRGRYWHRRTGERWLVTERWATVGDVRDRHVELVLDSSGIIERAMVHTSWKVASMTSTVQRTGGGYLVTVAHPDGVREEGALAGPAAPSEQVAWSVFGLGLVTGLLPEQLWDGGLAVGSLTVAHDGGSAMIKRPTQVAHFTINRGRAGSVEIVFTAYSGQLAYARRLCLIPDSRDAAAHPPPASAPAEPPKVERRRFGSTPDL